MATNDWPRITGDNGNTYSTNATLPINLAEKFNPIANGYIPSVISNGTLYTVDKTYNKLYAIDLSTNIVKWEFSDIEPLSIISLQCMDNYIYVLSGGKLYALVDEGSTYSLKWTVQGVGQTNLNDSSVFYSSSEPNSPPIVVSIDSKTGSEKFRVNVGALRDGIGPFAVGGGRLYFPIRNQMTDMYSKLYCISATTGQVLWIFDVGVYGIVSTYIPAYRDEKVYLDYEPSYQGTKQYLIAAFDAATGRTLWKYNLKAMFSQNTASNRYVVTNDSVITMSIVGYLISINKDTGVERWRVKYTELVNGRETPTSINGTTIAIQNKIIIGNNRSIKIYDATKGTLLRNFTPADGSYRPVVAAQNVLITTNLQKLVMYAPAAADADTTKPTVDLDSVDPPRFSPYELNQGNTIIATRLWEETFTQLEVINENNQVIRTIDFGLVKAGAYNFIWDGMNDQGNPAPYGKYHFAFQLKDVAENTARYEYPDKVATIGDIIGKTLNNANLRTGPGTQYSIITVIPVNTELRILDETFGWYRVTFGGNYTGYVAKNLVSTRSNPGTIPTPPPSTIAYTVQPGDTLSGIASKFGITFTEIISVNPTLTNPNILYVGQQLFIPAKVFLIVTPGDTLWAISNKYQVPMDAIIRANNLTNPNNLYVGQRLIIPVQSQPPTRIIHTVSPGDTLWLISQKYQVPISTIVSTNNLVNPDSLYVEQKLIIK